MSKEPYGVIVAFDREEDLILAADRLHRQGVTLETYTPHPVPAIDAILERPPSPLPLLVFVAGMIGAGGGFLLQYWGMALAYPFNIGGRPLDSWPAFMPSTFEIGVLLAFVLGFLGYLVLTRLATLYHPIFAAPGFEGASQDRYLICVRGRRRAEVVVLLGPLRPHLIDEVPG